MKGGHNAHAIIHDRIHDPIPRNIAIAIQELIPIYFKDTRDFTAIDTPRFAGFGGSHTRI